MDCSESKIKTSIGVVASARFFDINASGRKSFGQGISPQKCK